MRFSTKSFIWSLAALSLSSVEVSSTAVSVSPVIQPPPAIAQIATESKGNPVGQLVGYVKDSVVRMKDGSVQLYSNHKRCNEIRTKQREYLSITAASLPESEQKAAMKYNVSAGGISYEEFNFLGKGKDDRGKLANILFMMVFSPNFVPYAFMFFPEMLPSPFAKPMNKMGLPHTKWQEISRERTHAVVQTLLDLEKAARVAPMISNLNPFGKGKTKRMMEQIDRLGHDIGGFLLANDASGAQGAELVLKILKDEIYTVEKPKKNHANLVAFPGAAVAGLGRALEAPSFNTLIPTFIVRGKVLNALKKIESADQFLVAQNIDLNSLSPDLLHEACSDRLIGGLGPSEDELVERLGSWLDSTVRQPEKIVKETGAHYNGNFARAALLCYNLLDGTRDGRSVSYLPRLLFQGQMSKSQTLAEIEDSAGKRKWK
jgi:hypothetical protein